MEIKEIKQNFVSTFPQEFIKTAIWYGNKEGRDIDVFLILRNRVPYNCFQYQRFDISYINQTEVNEMLSNFNPLITEPILTGEELCGEYLSALKKRLSPIKTNHNTVKYLINRAKEFYSWAQEHFIIKEYKRTIITLSFVISFINFADYYRNHKQVITFKELNEKFPNNLLSETMKWLKNKDQIEEIALIRLFKEIKNILDKY